MSLKTATLIVIIGLSLGLLSQTVVGFYFFSLRSISEIIVQISLLNFFVTLFRNQKGGKNE